MNVIVTIHGKDHVLSKKEAEKLCKEIKEGLNV